MRCTRVVMRDITTAWNTWINECIYEYSMSRRQKMRNNAEDKNNRHACYHRSCCSCVVAAVRKANAAHNSSNLVCWSLKMHSFQNVMLYQRCYWTQTASLINFRWFVHILTFSLLKVFPRIFMLSILSECLVAVATFNIWWWLWDSKKRSFVFRVNS